MMFAFVRASPKERDDRGGRLRQSEAVVGKSSKINLGAMNHESYKNCRGIGGCEV